MALIAISATRVLVQYFAVLRKPKISVNRSLANALSLLDDIPGNVPGGCSINLIMRYVIYN